MNVLVLSSYAVICINAMCNRSVVRILQQWIWGLHSCGPISLGDSAWYFETAWLERIILTLKVETKMLSQNVGHNHPVTW